MLVFLCRRLLMRPGRGGFNWSDEGTHKPSAVPGRTTTFPEVVFTCCDDHPSQRKITFARARASSAMNTLVALAFSWEGRERGDVDENRAVGRLKEMFQRPG